MGIDVDGYWHIAKSIADQCKSDFVLPNRGVTLTIEDRVNERELPCGRSLVGENAVASAVEMKIFGFVADLCERREPRANMKIHVAQVCVLGNVEADGDCRGIAGADLKINIAHSRIEGVFVGVRYVVIGRNAARRWKGNALPGTQNGGRTCARKHDHDALAGLKSRRVVCQYENRPGGAIPDEPDTRPKIDGARQPVAARGNEHDSLANATFRFVDRRLNRCRVVADSIAMRPEVLRR